ncbi:MAG: hypothetical protein ACRD18_06535 [Terriglobia bacterium]
MAPATKYPGNPVLQHGPEGSPDAERAQFYGSIINVDGKYRMWYCAESEPAGGMRSSSFRPAYAESEDGIHWTKPKLGLVEFNGNKENNLLLFSPQPHFEITEPLASFVLYESSDPDPAHRYKMPLYGRFYDANDVTYKHPKSTIYPYFSADGLRWQLATPPPKGHAYNEKEAPIRVQGVFEIGGFYKFDGLYYVAGQEISPDVWMPDGKEVGRVMVTHRSSDFVHWSKDQALSFVRYGYRSRKENLNEAHEPAAVWNRNNVLLATYGMWQGSKNLADLRLPLGFLISNDGIHFREPQPDFAILSPGATDAWDQHGLIHGQGFENVGDQTYVYYGTWDLASKQDRKTSVGLSMLRRDGFGYLSTQREGDAMLTTIPLVFPRDANGIRVNASGLGQDARLRLELLDELGKGLPGYSGSQGAIVDHDGVAERVSWSNRNLPPIPGPCRLRIHFEGANKSNIRFYAGYIGGA